MTESERFNASTVMAARPGAAVQLEIRLAAPNFAGFSVLWFEGFNYGQRRHLVTKT
jgi:hypothetical protein